MQSIESPSRETTTAPLIQGIDVSLSQLIQLRMLGESLSFKNKNSPRSHLSGSHLSQMRGRGIDFDEVRAYHPGDDIRNMDWRVTARTGKPHTKLYHEERERPVFIVVDYRQPMFFGTKVCFKSVIAAQAASYLAWAATKHGDRVGGIVFSENKHVELQPKARKNGVLPLLKTLSEDKSFQTNEPNSNAFSSALQRLRFVAKPGSLIFILSDFSDLNESIESHLSRLSQHNQVYAGFISDPVEAQAPPANYYGISDGDNIVTINTGVKALRKYYEQQYAQHYRSLKSILKRRNIPLLEFATDQDVFSVLQQRFAHYAGR